MFKYEYRPNGWEKIGEDLYRKENRGVYGIFSEKDIEMKKHNGVWISEFEYDRIMDDITDETYENLMAQELANQKPFRINLESLIGKVKYVWSDFISMNDKDFFQKYFKKI